MSSSGGSISAFLGSKWATVAAVALLAAGAVMVPVITGDVDPSANYFTPYCTAGATNVTTAAAVRTQISADHDACLTQSITGDVNLSGLSALATQVHFGTTDGVSITGSVDVHGSRRITLNVRATSVGMNGGTTLRIDNSVLGGTGPLLSQRTHDDLIYVANPCTGCELTHSELAWTYIDFLSSDHTAVDPNTGYGCHCNSDWDSGKVVGNWIHDTASDGLQIGGGTSLLIDRNEVGPVGAQNDLPNDTHTGWTANDTEDQHADVLQMTGHADGTQVTNNWFHGQGYYDYGTGEGNPGDPTGVTDVGNAGATYIHGGSSTNSLLYQNNLVQASRGRVEFCGLGTGGVDSSNITIQQNTFYDLGRALSSFPGFEWDCDTGSGNVILRNIAVDPDNGFANDGSGYTSTDNLFGQLALVTLDTDGNCTSVNCTTVGGDPIGYRKPGGVFW